MKRNSKRWCHDEAIVESERPKKFYMNRNKKAHFFQRGRKIEWKILDDYGAFWRTGARGLAKNKAAAIRAASKFVKTHKGKIVS